MGPLQDKFTQDNQMRQHNKRHRKSGKFLFLCTIKVTTQALSMKGRGSRGLPP